MFFKKKRYSIRKSRHILRHIYSMYRKQRAALSDENAVTIESNLQELEQAIFNGDRDQASLLAKQAQEFSEKHFKQTWWHSFGELAFALAFALVIAIIVRSMWFELYEIPTGSMRPTFREQDRLTVTKTAFGINVPLETAHFYFDPSLVQRGSGIIFSGDGLALADTETTYFGIIPYTKRYIKRMIGKPGDTLYFYGGKIYGIDKKGNPLPDLIDPPWMQKIEHIPFLTFEGDLSNKPDAIRYLQMHEAVARLYYTAFGELKGEIFNGKHWVKEEPPTATMNGIHNLGDLWGINNFAMARLLTADQVKKYTDQKTGDMEEGVLYLELKHSPTLPKPRPVAGRINLMMQKRTSVLPLEKRHLDAIMDHMYTARFVVKDGRATRYSANGAHFSFASPKFSDVPDGTYELYYGKGYRVEWGGILSELPSDHPLLRRTPENIQKLYNLGIQLNTAFEPKAKNQVDVPHRYAYYRDGDLYLLGGAIYRKDDPVLQSFIAREEKRKQPYRPFKDYGPPKDKAFIREYGITVPAEQYLVLGDNHAMSADSRVFGFVPQENLQGAPSFIIWPPGDRWGLPSQKPYPIFVAPRLIVWSIAVIVAIISYSVYRWNCRRSLFDKK